MSNSTEVPFKVSARTAKLIGLENFSNEEGAIIELVKNTYDADSKRYILIFDLKYDILKNELGEENKVFNKSKSKIYIIDNGIGMTAEIISNQWMTIGTDDKLYKYTSERGRAKTGAKGIGRFALNRLGLITNLHTISKETQEKTNWKVDWRDFDRPGATVSDIKATLTTSDELSLKNILIEEFIDYKRITDLINIIPFDSGTIIEISELNDHWEEEELVKLFENLEMLLPPKEQSDFKIDLLSTNNLDSFREIKTAYYDDYDYKVVANYDNEKENNLQIRITRNELDINALEN